MRKKRVHWPDLMVRSRCCRERWGRFLQGGWEGDTSEGCQAWGGHLPVQISSSPISCLAGISLSSVLLPPPTPPPPLPLPGPPPAAAPPPATEPFIWPSSVRENTDFLEEEGGHGTVWLSILGRAQHPAGLSPEYLLRLQQKL